MVRVWGCPGGLDPAFGIRTNWITALRIVSGDPRSEPTLHLNERLGQVITPGLARVLLRGRTLQDFTTKG